MKILMQTTQMHQIPASNRKKMFDEQNYFYEKFVLEQTSSNSIKLNFFLFFHFDEKNSYISQMH